ncbi:hypothetical protein BVY03_04720, partial [bacterium K02(2017)]
MSWTGAQLGQFARSLAPATQGNILLMGSQLPNTLKPYPGRDNKLSIDDYNIRDVSEEFNSFYRFVGNHEIDRVLNADYWDGDWDRRQMHQLGGHFGDRSVHLSYQSKTNSGKLNSYGLVIGAENGYQNPEIAVTKNFAGVVMTPGWNRLQTGASYFVIKESELKSRFGEWDLYELAATMFVAQNGGYRSHVQVQDRESSDPQYVSDAIVASSRYYPNLGQVELMRFNMGGEMYAMVVVNNIIDHNNSTHDHAQNGLVRP